MLQQVPLRRLGGPVAQLSSWVRASQNNKPIFFLLALSEEGHLEQMRIQCKKAEPGVRRPQDSNPNPRAAAPQEVTPTQAGGRVWPRESGHARAGQPGSECCEWAP